MTLEGFDTNPPAGWEALPAPDSLLNHAAAQVQMPAVQRMPLRRFFRGGEMVECVERAVEAVVSPGEVGYVAEIPTLGLAAAGAGVSDAVQELAEHVVHFFNFYSRLDADEVIGDATRLRELYVREFRRGVVARAA